jgi:hypothetical protein
LSLRTLVGLAGPGELGWASGGFRRASVGVGSGYAGLSGDGTRGGDHGGTALVDVVELLSVLGGCALHLDLRGHGRGARSAIGCDLGGLRADVDAAAASVIGDTGVVVDHDGAVVDVSDVDVYAVDGAVVVEVVSVPVAAVIAVAGVAEAVVDASVEADVEAPVAAAVSPAVVVPTPVAGGPEGSVIGRGAPCAGDPVVAGGAPVPVAGGPEVVGGGGDGLLVNGKWGWGLVGVFNGWGFAILIELIVGLSVLIGLVLIGWWRRGRILIWRGRRRGSLLGYLLGLRLRAVGDSLGWGGRLGWLGVIDGGHVGVGGVGSGVVWSGGGGGVPVAAGGSGEECDDSE